MLKDRFDGETVRIRGVRENRDIYTSRILHGTEQCDQQSQRDL